jgi:hypothetical protein
MYKLLTPFVRSRLLKIVVSSGAVLLLATDALAAPRRLVTASASGQIVSRALCSASEVCQETHVAGTATVLGDFVAVLSDVINITDGTYTGTGLITTSDGSTITTEYTGQATPPDQNGRVWFFESQHVVSGTGQYANASGELEVVGTADAAGHVRIVGVGWLRK